MVSNVCTVHRQDVEPWMSDGIWSNACLLVGQKFPFVVMLYSAFSLDGRGTVDPIQTSFQLKAPLWGYKILPRICIWRLISVGLS